MASYVEVEMGKRSDRPGLAKALCAARSAYAMKANATTLSVICDVQKSGVTSLIGIARTLGRGE